ncbi:phosphoribosylglycinamide formyltransferase [Gracilinema caldarium]|uniref:Phosphoribosylglycinamide formyltransferase n=1 Tax=Gracilinema caldarium (strain ATCC 51460 / DSM 7334 / H1) TaxID=744872 RepID=F8F478_GRAC1|nr:phosphoribosylglycinamide formyltransferase [Gracilinema caldarium]AEJ20525.1 phosphoribosylglycinamide formyltransferase [Gracilinema caldarium DSM 7334]
MNKNAVTGAAATEKKVSVAVLVSGNGTNLQALLDAERAGRLAQASIKLVISDRPGAYALERAKQAGKPAMLIEPNRSIPRDERRLDLSNRILAAVQNTGVELIVLAGFLSILQGPILEYYRGRIINIHPSLLPKFGGPGMYGERVHQAVLEAGEMVSGCTVHIVDQGTDTGPILLQRTVPILPQDTPDSLANRIHSEEHIAIVDGVIELVTRLGYTT